MATISVIIKALNEERHIAGAIESALAAVAPYGGEVILAAGAIGNGAIYTQHGHHIHIVRKVIMRVGSFMNWLVLKLH